MDSKELVQRYLREAWDEGRPEAIETYLAPDFRSLNAPPGSPGDRAAEAAMLGGFREAFGDFRSTIEEQVAQDDAVVTRWSAVGTSRAPFLGIPATGTEISMRGTELAVIRDGQIASIHAIFDMVGLLQALGAPAPPPVQLGSVETTVDRTVAEGDRVATLLRQTNGRAFWSAFAIVRFGADGVADTFFAPDRAAIAAQLAPARA